MKYKLNRLIRNTPLINIAHVSSIAVSQASSRLGGASFRIGYDVGKKAYASHCFRLDDLALVGATSTAQGSKLISDLWNEWLINER